MERIKVAAWEGIAQFDASPGEEPRAALLLNAEGDRDISIEIDLARALEIVPALIASLGTLATEMMEQQFLIPAVGWQVDLAPKPPHQPMIHAYLQHSGERLSLAIHPESLRPLARILDRKADELEAKGKAPLAPGSRARN